MQIAGQLYQPDTDIAGNTAQAKGAERRDNQAVIKKSWHQRVLIRARMTFTPLAR
jgi:hypothetical protein